MLRLSVVPYGRKDLEQSPLEAQPRWPRAKLALEIVMRENGAGVGGGREIDEGSERKREVDDHSPSLWC